MAENKRKYWLHRITGGENAIKLTHPLLFEHNVLSTGWASLSWDDFVTRGRNDWNAFEREFYNEYGGMRNRWSLWRFLKMGKGDLVVVPTWGEFSIYRIADDSIYTNQSLSSLLDIENLQDWNGEHVHVTKDNNGYFYLYDEHEKFIDLGFFRKVEPVVLKLPRQLYADQALYSRMKILQTNADISDISGSIEDAIKRGKSEAPISIHEELIKSTLQAAQQTITDYTQHHKYEELVEKYLRAIGATEVVKPAPNETSTECGDADRVAYFEELKVAILVQVKKHNSITNEWAVNQIIAYKDNHTNADYNVQMWVISNANEFTEEAKRKANAENVRLINGQDFARMILEVGLKHFE